MDSQRIPRRRRVLKFVLLLIILVGVVTGATVALVPKEHLVAVARGERPWNDGRSMHELIRYAERRLQGHAILERVALPFLHLLQRQIERPVPDLVLEGRGKGASPQAAFASHAIGNVRAVASSDQLREAVAQARPGDSIELAPGRYVLSRLTTPRPGEAMYPITVSGKVFPESVIEFRSEEGFLVTQPNWVFQNLVIRGGCSRDHDCEHAFHVVGKASNTIIRNNRIEEFNAHIKINAVGKDIPDRGRIEFNTLINKGPRETDRPVTIIDLVAAADWVVADNIVANFAKRGGRDKVSYGIYMKGGGSGGRIERNLVVCSTSEISRAGVRVGVSFGGGGTGGEFCRGDCNAEFSSGFVLNNVIAHCNDFGIDVFRSKNILIAHNALINTAGIDVRHIDSSARAYGNLLEGLVRSRYGARLKIDMNEITDMKQVFVDADRLDLVWRNRPERIPSMPKVLEDFCGIARGEGTLPGVFENEAPCPGVDRRGK